MLKLVEKCNDYMGSQPDYQQAKLVLVGAPMDFTTSYRPGTRMGPQQIRMVSYGLEEYSVYLDKELTQCQYFDAGDVVIPFGNVTGGLNNIAQTIDQILSDGKFPLLLGGEHLVSLPAILQQPRADRDKLIADEDSIPEYGQANDLGRVRWRLVRLLGGWNEVEITLVRIQR